MEKLTYFGFRDDIVKEAARSVQRHYFKALDKAMKAGVKKTPAIKQVTKDMGISNKVGLDMFNKRIADRATGAQIRAVQSTKPRKAANTVIKKVNKTLGTDIKPAGTKKIKAVQSEASANAMKMKKSIQKRTPTPKKLVQKQNAPKVKDTKQETSKSKAKSLWLKHRRDAGMVGGGAIAGAGIGSLLTD